jgi:hypothetical protein
MRVFARLLIATTICLAATDTARAEDEDDGGEESGAPNDDALITEGGFDKETWPLEVVNRPLTLAGGMVEIRGDSLRIGISGGDAFDVGEPIVLAPEIYYGVSDKLTVGITHTNHATFFPPAGFCLSGEENGCPKPYNAIGAEAQYALTRGGNLNLAARAGISTGRFSPDFALGATAGLLIRFRGGKIALVVDPNLYIGIIERDTFPFGMADASYPDYLFMPAQLQYQLNTQAMVYLMSGLNTPLKDMGDFVQIPAGLGASYALNDRMDAGLELQIANLAGKDIGPIGKFDERYLIARIAIRL